MKEIDKRVYEMADEGLLELIEKARVSQLTPEEYAIYQAEMKIIGDAGSAEWYGYDRGKKEGIEQGKKEGIEQGKKEGIEQGKKEGTQQESLRYAREMKEEGISVDVIMKISHLSREEIERL